MMQATTQTPTTTVFDFPGFSFVPGDIEAAIFDFELMEKLNGGEE